MNNWDIINNEVEKSTIKRFPWKNLLGVSLTKYILEKKALGFDPIQTYSYLITHPEIIQYMILHRELAYKMQRNIKISVSARYGENNTALKIFKQCEKGGKIENALD